VLKPTGRLEGNKGTVSALAFSPDGSLVAAGDSAGKIILYNTQDKNVSLDVHRKR
jgi:WD40 repeat protein